MRILLVEDNPGDANLIREMLPQSGGVRFELECLPRLAVEVDVGQINQAVNNLVLNAVQAMPEGGTILVRADNAGIREGETPSLKPGRFLRISIRDQGPGIPSELLGKIFDPYFTTKERGRGLGLSTVYSIVKNHGGQVTVDSRPGAGTVFTLFLPASSRPVAGPVETMVGKESFEARILVMDDESMVCDMVAVTLREVGCDVRCARDGREMLKMYREAGDSGEPFDLVIMDLTIPGGMGGEEAIKELLAFDPGAKAIVSSGYSSGPVMAEYRKHGFAAILTKPYNFQQITETVRKTLGGRDDDPGRKGSS